MPMGFAFRTKWSVQMMWKLKTRAQTLTKASPLERVNSSLMQSRYMPAMPIRTAIQTTAGLFFLNRIRLITGTRSMYMAVMNPAFPALVWTMPICWNSVAVARHRPQRIPPIIVFLLYCGFSGPFFPLPRTTIGVTAIAARSILTALNVEGSMLSIPMRWNANAVPQIAVVMRRRIFPSSFLFFISF